MTDEKNRRRAFNLLHVAGQELSRADPDGTSCRKRSTLRCKRHCTQEPRPAVKTHVGSVSYFGAGRASSRARIAADRRPGCQATRKSQLAPGSERRTIATPPAGKWRR